MLTKIKEGFASLPLPAGLKKPQLLIAIMAVVLTSAIVFSLWRANQDYVLLYGEREQIPISRVVEVLGTENIAYRIHPDNGQLLVAENNLPRARMALAAKGIAAPLPDGYQLMDQEALLGGSQFIWNVRYKRSLEGELSRSIMALDSVENARVHLGISESSSFVIANKPESSASVMLQLYSGQQLNEQQVSAIVQLVAGSVPGLQADRIQVVDQTGNLLSADLQADQQDSTSLHRIHQVIQQIKTDTTHNLSQLLLPLVGSGNFRISVSSEVDLSKIEETQEHLGKQPQISDETLSKENSLDELALGIPGSLSNRPTNRASSPPRNNQPKSANSEDPRTLATRSQEQRKFVFDRDIRHVRHPGYRLEKLHVAVVLNQSAPALADITETQLTRLSRLLEDAAGIEKTRGDSLTLDRLNFIEQPSEPIPTVKWWQDPEIRLWAQNGGIGLLALLTLLFGVRPLIQALVQLTKPESEGLPNPDREQAANISLAKQLPENNLLLASRDDDNLPPQGSGLETKVAYLQILAQKETERVADVLKQWINTHERIDNKQE